MERKRETALGEGKKKSSLKKTAHDLGDAVGTAAGSMEKPQSQSAAKQRMPLSNPRKLFLAPSIRTETVRSISKMSSSWA